MTDIAIAILLLYIWAGVAVTHVDEVRDENAGVLLLKLCGYVLLWPAVYAYQRLNPKD